MNTTNANYFTFNAHNSMLLLGQTGSGKSHLAHKLVDQYQNAMSSDDIKFIFIDLKQVEFQTEGEDFKKEYLFCDVIEEPNYALQMLIVLADKARERIDRAVKQPLLFVYIEENDAAYLNQTIFDEAVKKINSLAKAANIKLIYSTSRPDETSISGDLFHSFDLVLSGPLVDSDRERLELPPNPTNKYEFNVTELK